VLLKVSEVQQQCTGSHDPATMIKGEDDPGQQADKTDERGDEPTNQETIWCSRALQSW